MKLNINYVFGILLIITGACKKSDAPADWEQGKNQVTIALNKTEIRQKEYLTVSLNGYADSVIIYDGTLGHEYKFKDRTVMETVKPSVSFTSYRQWGNQENTLKVLVSNNFKGANYDSKEINDANWTNITDRFVLSTGNDNTASGKVDLGNFLSAGKQLYFAFQFNGKEGTTQRTWTVKNFEIKNELPGGVIETVAETGTAGWKQFSFLNPNQIWTFNSSQLQIVGGNAAATDNDDWLITKILNFGAVNPDRASHIVKTRFQNMPRDFKIGYANPGNYEMHVVAKDAAGNEVANEKVLITVLEN